MKSKKIMGVLGSILCVAAIMPTDIFAASINENVDYTVSIEGELDPSMPVTYGLFKDYVAYCDRWWILNSSNVGVGAAGWTDIDNKSDGSDRWHYSNIQVYSSSGTDCVTYESGRRWGYGRVEVSTGDLGKGAMYSHRIFYGW